MAVDWSGGAERGALEADREDGHERRHRGADRGDRHGPDVATRLAHVFCALVPELTGVPPVPAPTPPWLQLQLRRYGGARYWVLLCEVERRFDLLTRLSLRPAATYAFWAPVHRGPDGWDLCAAWAQCAALLMERHHRVVPPR